MTNPSIVRALAAAGAVFFAAVPAAAQRPTVPMEIFVSQQEFAPELRVADQEIAGFRLGIDLADYAGLRGFYWRGVNGDRDGVAPIQSYGVEAQLNLNSGRGITPFLVAGVGRVDFMDGFRDVDGNHPGDKDAAILGGGARLDLGRVGLMASARSYLFQAGDSIDDDLRNNLQLSAGLTFRLGSPGRRRVAAARPTVIRETPDTVYVTQEGTVVRTERRDGDDPDQFVTIPIPREGEIYLRYGPADSSTVNRRPAARAGAVAAGEMEALRRQVVADLEPMLRELMVAERTELREMVRDELQRIGAAGLTPEAEQRLLENLEARVALRVQERVGTAPAERPARTGFSPRLREWRGYTSGNVDRPRQFIVGGRVDLGPLNASNPSLRVIPELAAGGGQGGLSVLLATNLQLDLSSFEVGGAPLQPYVYGGLGLLVLTDPNPGRAEREAVLNLGYGVNFPVPGRSGGPRLFLEHQGIDLFDLNRLLIGIRF
jgi:hypothetical protein